MMHVLSRRSHFSEKMKHQLDQVPSGNNTTNGLPAVHSHTAEYISWLPTRLLASLGRR